MTLSARAADEYDTLREEIAESVLSGQPVDVSSYGLTPTQLQEIYDDMLHRGLLPWYVDSYVDWTSDSSGKATVMRPRDMRDRGYDEKQYEQAMAELIATTCHEGMTQEQMVLSVHDHMVTRIQCSYWGNYNNGYHALVRGETACYGYSLLFMRVMEQIDIPCRIVVCKDTGDGVGHAWNAVCLNGNWYHLDLTWDDPLADVDGRVLHNNFLKTDKEFKSEESGHTFDWDTDVSCEDRTYAFSPLWEDAESPFLFPGDGYMYYREDDRYNIYIFKQNLTTKEETLVYKQEQPLISVEGKNYYCTTYGLAIRGGRIWFDTPEAVYSVTLGGEEKKAEYVCETLADANIIHGFQIVDNNLLVSYMDFAYNITKKQIALTDEPDHIHSYAVQTVGATCNEAGYKQHQCDCGIVFYTEKRAALGHDLICEQTGTGKMQICQRCSYSIPVPEDDTTESLWDPAWIWGIAGGTGLLGVSVVLLLCIRKKKRLTTE